MRATGSIVNRLAFIMPAAEPRHEREQLARTLSLRGAVTLNLLDMIGVGPFITLPLLMAAMGGPQAMLGWICGALLALCDGLVWAELGAAMPEAGGTYRFLRVLYPGQWGRWLSFLFVFQLCFSAPLSAASGCIGLSEYATALWPRLASAGITHTAHVGSYTFGVSARPATAVAIAALLIAVALLYRRLEKIARLSTLLLGVVLLTLGWTYATAVLHGHASQIFAGADWHIGNGFWMGLGSAMLVATYDYWGYYNITFLGGEARDAARTVPRAVLLSIGIVAVLYLLLNASVLSVLPASVLIGQSSDEARRAMLSLFMRTAYAPSLGMATATLLGKVAAGMVMLTAFASVFALLLGYSRIPFAAAREGGFLRVFGRLHPTRGFPYVSLLALGAVACVACFFSLAEVIAALVVLRICLQFLLQHVGVMLWRKRAPDAPRPFRMWLYPLPPIVAIAGFLFVVTMRRQAGKQLLLAAIVAVVGTLVYFATRRASETAADSFS
jgi:amino acid transporter